jgi:hypothetical protein
MSSVMTLRKRNGRPKGAHSIIVVKINEKEYEYSSSQHFASAQTLIRRCGSATGALSLVIFLVCLFSPAMNGKMKNEKEYEYSSSYMVQHNMILSLSNNKILCKNVLP